MKLNLGSHTRPRPGYVNIDILDWPGVDRMVDLNRLPWPFPDKSVDEVVAIDILEHLGKLSKWEILTELGRITKPGARVIVRVPCMTHYISLNSLQHAHSFYFDSFLPSYGQPYFLPVKMWCFVAGRRVPMVTPIHKIIRVLAYFRFVQMIEWELVRHNDPWWAKAPGTPDELNGMGEM